MVAREGSERVSWEAVDEAICRAQAGVVVPIPRPVFTPPLGVTERKAPEEVANFELGARTEVMYVLVSIESAPLPPEVLTKPLPVKFEIAPRLPAPRLKLVANKFVDEATVAKKLVEVAEVVVALVMVALVRVRLVNCTKEGRESVQVLSAERSCEPAEEVI